MVEVDSHYQTAPKTSWGSTPPLDTPEVVGGPKTRLLEGPKSIGSLWAIILCILGGHPPFFRV